MQRHRGRSIIEVSVVLMLILAAMWLLRISPLARWQSKHFHWNYLSHIVQVAVPLLILLTARRKLSNYGLTLANWRYGLKWGLLLSLATAAPVLLAVVFGRMAIRPIGVGPPVLDTLAFKLIFVGFGEELLFRGYFQSRVNEEFGRPWRLWGFQFGMGLVVASVLFGIGHVLNPFNPLAGRFVLDPWGAMTIVAAVVWGLMREKTGSILGPAVWHGSLFWRHYVAM